VASGYESVGAFDAGYEVLLRDHFLKTEKSWCSMMHTSFRRRARICGTRRSRAILTGQRSLIECPLTVNGKFPVSFHREFRRWDEDEVLLSNQSPRSWPLASAAELLKWSRARKKSGINF